MLDIGIFGLDTSHAEAFATSLSEKPGVKISAVWDSGDVRDQEYANWFCERYGATSYASPKSMYEVIDAAMILTVNWDIHSSLAVPFLDRGIPTFIDKPVAGRYEDISAIADAADQTPLFGGSAIPFHPGLAEIPSELPERHLYCVGYDDPFYYGVHLADTVRVLAGVNWTAVKSSKEPGDVVTVAFENGTYATLRLDGPTDGTAFGVMDVGNQIRAEVLHSDEGTWETMYSRFIDAFLAAVRGERNETSRILNGATLLLAIQAALSTNGQTTITPASDELRTVHPNGEEFMRSYSPYY